MKAITYRNTITNAPGIDNKFHEIYHLGYAYQTNTHFVHFYGYDHGFHGIQVNGTATEGKLGTLEDWVKRNFGAIDLKEMELDVGDSIEGVWRPCLWYMDHITQALKLQETEMRSAEQSLRLLITQLDDLFLYIEPSANGLKAYSHKTRQLLILACTEVENFWKYYLKKANVKARGKYFTTIDYVQLAERLLLRDYKLNLRMYSTVPDIKPFLSWDSAAPSDSIDWYDAYNKTKHDREVHFSAASLWNCIQAVSANVVLHCIRFGPIGLFHQSDALSSLFTQHFKVELINSSTDKFYLYNVDLPKNLTQDFAMFSSLDAGCVKPFNVKPFTMV